MLFGTDTELYLTHIPIYSLKDPKIPYIFFALYIVVHFGILLIFNSVCQVDKILLFCLLSTVLVATGIVNRALTKSYSTHTRICTKLEGEEPTSSFVGFSISHFFEFFLDFVLSDVV